MTRQYRRTTFSRIAEESKAKALEMIAAGAYRVDIARACSISPNSVDGLAKRAGLKLSKMKRGRRTTWRSLPPKANPVEGVNWRAIAANLRWGGGGFHG